MPNLWDKFGAITVVSLHHSTSILTCCWTIRVFWRKFVTSLGRPRIIDDLSSTPKPGAEKEKDSPEPELPGSCRASTSFR
ncbi:unnamed protein product, partial [Protopolystoma xenopodis]